MTLEELAELEECPCEMCSSQDNEENIKQKEKMDEICDIYSNYLIDYLIENPNKAILKELSEKSKLEEDE